MFNPRMANVVLLSEDVLGKFNTDLFSLRC